MPADAGSRVVAPAPAAAHKLGAGGPAGGQVLPFLVSHAVNSFGLAGRVSGDRPCVLTASDKLFMMKSLWALFFAMATLRLFSKTNANKDLSEPRLKMMPT